MFWPFGRDELNSREEVFARTTSLLSSQTLPSFCLPARPTRGSPPGKVPSELAVISEISTSVWARFPNPVDRTIPAALPHRRALVLRRSNLRRAAPIGRSSDPARRQRSCAIFEYISDPSLLTGMMVHQHYTVSTVRECLCAPIGLRAIALVQHSSSGRSNAPAHTCSGGS